MKFNVSPLTCGRCVITITQALLAVEPDARVTVNLAAGTVDFDGALDAAAVAATLAPHGYSAVPADGPATPEPASADHCCGSCHV
ncbi:MAG: heavy-metal-associated domain-containing protein [Pseudomonadota bacterium]